MCDIVHSAALSRRIQTFARLLTMAVITLVVAAESHAQQITIKRPFFRGWRYAVDSSKYQRVGSGENLKEMMKESRACMGAMRSFNDHATAAKITGTLSLLLVVWPVTTQIRGKEWSSSYTPMVIVGGTFGIVSLAMDAAGSRNLKRAVMIHNRSHGFGGDFDSMLPPPDNLSPGVRLTLRF